ncbi:cation-translocating P-type ATPase [Cryobacterium arcticum]|uniref:Carbonate dehydratase n=1 Tax=Cryobacterium arcticum TaxID=670052 RepID=A0A1B1BQ97_9MICO|nr:HAD-IC family P-type ATPase [Cryobacterium arcticum]ANP74716.1 carbonate dehydratase [Cryobacterium arcticum]
MTTGRPTGPAEPSTADTSEGSPRMAAPYASSADAVCAALSTTRHGLGVADAAERLARSGPNTLPLAAKTNPVLRFLGHFNDVLIYVLLGSAVLTVVFGEWVDAAVILAVAVINAVIGFLQEGRAEKALDGIRRMLSLTAMTRRGGNWVNADAGTLVPGDIVRVKPGDKVPADLRLVEGTNLRVDESALTGESVPTSKTLAAVAADAGIGDRTCMLFSGTIVVAGSGTGVVTATGSATEIGRIQSLVTDAESLATPLTRQLDAFSTRVSLAILAVSGLMLVIGRFVHDRDFADLFAATIGFAVAAVPEGLPALVTITLALGVRQMATHNAIVRKLTAVETLGSVTTVCTDKTGTLTRNEMTVRTVITGTARYDVHGIGYDPVGAVLCDGRGVTTAGQDDLARLVEVMAVCNDARVAEADGVWRVVGEPTEGALRTLAQKAGFETSGYDRLAVIPFESANKFMATLSRLEDQPARVLLKGAPGRVLERCTHQLDAAGLVEPLDEDLWKRRIDELSSAGLRVLGAAVADAPADLAALHLRDIEDGMLFLGVVGIVDPPRPEAIAAIATMHAAGIRVKMITGDHPGTAVAIAREMGIVDGDARVLTGGQLQKLSQDQLAAVVRNVDVFARTSPEHKLRIVKALQSHGEVVAMTGDGVNDAPALQRADVGVAMGIKGTEATKEAADIVLADDNFATIQRAVEEGRRIRDNLQKSIIFILPTTAAQSLVVLLAVLFGFALPLQPTQILWVNLITAVTLSLALATEPAEPGIMLRPPRSPGGSVLDSEYLGRLLWVSVLITAATIGVFFFELSLGSSRAQAQTTAVTMLVLSQLAFLFNSRFLRASSLTAAVLHGNRMVWLSVGTMLVLQLVFVYTPIMNVWFSSTPIGVREWAYTLGLALIIFLLVELNKLIGRRRARRRLIGRTAGA